MSPVSLSFPPLWANHLVASLSSDSRSPTGDMVPTTTRRSRVVAQDPARVLAVGAVDDLDLLETMASRWFLNDLRSALADFAIADLVEVVRGAHARSIARDLDRRHRLGLVDRRHLLTYSSTAHPLTKKCLTKYF